MPQPWRPQDALIATRVIVLAQIKGRPAQPVHIRSISHLEERQGRSMAEIVEKMVSGIW
jgi:hypothetical protein